MEHRGYLRENGAVARAWNHGDIVGEVFFLGGEVLPGERAATSRTWIVKLQADGREFSGATRREALEAWEAML